MVRLFLCFLLILSSLSALCPPQECKEKETVDIPPPAKRLTLRHIEPQGVGYHQGYTTLDCFVALASPPSFIIPFVDVRGHIFDHGQPAVNAGFGLRFLTSSWVFGANSYFDYRKTKRAQYTQIGVGFEMLGKWIDLRLNGYFPAGNTKSDVFHTKFSHFRDHYAILKSRYEFALMGLNAEVGAHITDGQNAKCYAALGPYYFTGQGKNAVGGAARLSGTFYEYFQVEASGSYDPVFKWIGQGQVGLVFSFGPTRPPTPTPRCKKEPLLWQRTVQPVDRNEIIVLDRKNKESRAVDPSTGDPYLFWFVNNLSHSQGTIESPFPTLAQAASASNEGDIIYVFPGSGASYDVGVDGLTLQNNQKLWGSATEQSLNTTLGAVSIPPSTRSQPLFSGGSEFVGLVNLANHNEVSGIHFSAESMTAGFAITGADIHGGIIKNNTVEGNYGLSSFDISGKGSLTISNNALSVSLVPYLSSVIRVLSTNSDILYATISENTIDSPLTLYGITVVSNNTSQLTATIQGNIITLDGAIFPPVTGIGGGADNESFLKATIHSNQVLMATGTGIEIEISSSSNSCIQLTNNITSPPMITLDNSSGGIFNLAPSLGNIPSSFTEIGTITHVTSCD